MRSLIILLILGVVLLSPGLLHSQSITLEKTYSNHPVYLNIHQEGSDFVGFTNSRNPNRIMVGRIDSLLNEIYFKEVLDTITVNNGYYFDNSFQLRSGHEYIIVGSQTGGGETVFRMDSAANIQWRTTFSYPFFSYTSIDNIMLQDSSIVMAGYRLSGGGWRPVIRRVGELGQVIFENEYAGLGFRQPESIIDVFDGSMLVASTIGTNQIGLTRVDYFGNILTDTSIFIALNGNRGLLTLSLLPDGNLILRETNSINTIRFLLNHNLGILIFKQDNLKEQNRQYRINNDSTFYGSGFMMNINDQYLYTFGFDLNTKDSFDLDTLVNSLTVVHNYRDISKDEALLLGLRKIGSAPTANWLAWVTGLKDHWKPDPCIISKPQSAISYEYNHPNLILRDSSSSGVRYNDTIYAYTWNTSLSVAPFHDDSLTVFLDTSITKSLDVELIISNWYGCTDTANITLNFDPNGITEEKPLDVKIYPNPVSDYFKIELEGEHEGNTFFELFDLHGKRLEVVEMNSRSYHYPMERLPGGVYILKVESGNRQQRFRIVKL